MAKAVNTKVSLQIRQRIAGDISEEVLAKIKDQIRIRYTLGEQSGVVAGDKLHWVGNTLSFVVNVTVPSEGELSYCVAEDTQMADQKDCIRVTTVRKKLRGDEWTESVQEDVQTGRIPGGASGIVEFVSTYTMKKEYLIKGIILYTRSGAYGVCRWN